MAKTCILIPARYASSRFVAKPLAMIAGKPMIQHVWEQCQKSKRADQIFVLTDHEDIEETVESFGGRSIMTSPMHPTGTDRILEAIEHIDADYFINVQGDEPLIDPHLIDQLIQRLATNKVAIVTACNSINHMEDLLSYHVVKVVRGQQDRALYFSRQAIPAFRDLPYKEWLDNAAYFKHLGIYGFTKNALKLIKKLPKGKLELAESLEQLRWLEAGMNIDCLYTEYQSIGVDLPEDIRKVENLMG